MRMRPTKEQTLVALNKAYDGAISRAFERLIDGITEGWFDCQLDTINDRYEKAAKIIKEYY